MDITRRLVELNGHTDAPPNSLCIHDHLSLSLPTTHDGTGVAHCSFKDAGSEDGTGALCRFDPLLGEDFRNQLSAGRGDGHPDGVSVWDQLVGVFAPHRWRHRHASRDGRYFLLLPGVRVSWTLLIRREASIPQGALGLCLPGLYRLMALGLFHHRRQRLDATPGRISIAAERRV